MLGRAITLVESTSPRHRGDAQALLTQLMHHTGGAHRVGVTGVPGVGKSTFIEALGSQLTAQGHRVAVLAVDPSSSRTGGSILGDKTRMERLSRDPNAFVRPSPTSGTLGGVASHTREAMLICEAAGYDVVLVETVGVGQSELAVANMTDVFLVLMLAGAGDELQGIKRGLMELADVLVVNKADGDNLPAARRAAATYAGALRTLHPGEGPWKPRALTCSALHDQGVDQVWSVLLEHREALTSAGVWAANRQAQQADWMWHLVDEGLREALRSAPIGAEQVEGLVRAGSIAPTSAARQLLRAFLGR